MAVTDSWQEIDPVFANVESILGRSHRIGAVSIPGWREDFTGMMAGTQSSAVSHLSHHIIGSIPYDRVGDELLRVPEDMSAREANRIRDMRKLFMIARDGILLTTADPESLVSDKDGPYDKLMAMCRLLGKVADSRGSSEQTKKAIGTCELLSLEVPTEPKLIASNTEFFRRCTKLTKTKHLAKPKRNVDPEEYHLARIKFRRVANAGILAAVISDKKSHRKYAAQAVALSKDFGETKDLLIGDPYGC